MRSPVVHQYCKTLSNVSKIQTNIACAKNEHAMDYTQNSFSNSWNQASMFIPIVLSITVQ